jgi:hypothetical protein
VEKQKLKRKKEASRILKRNMSESSTQAPTNKESAPAHFNSAEGSTMTMSSVSEEPAESIKPEIHVCVPVPPAPLSVAVKDDVSKLLQGHANGSDGRAEGGRGEFGAADDPCVPRWLQEVMNRDEAMRRNQVHESDLKFIDNDTLKEAGIVNGFSRAKILRRIEICCKQECSIDSRAAVLVPKAPDSKEQGPAGNLAENGSAVGWARLCTTPQEDTKKEIFHQMTPAQQNKLLQMPSEQQKEMFEAMAKVLREKERQKQPAETAVRSRLSAPGPGGLAGLRERRPQKGGDGGKRSLFSRSRNTSLSHILDRFPPSLVIGVIFLFSIFLLFNHKEPPRRQRLTQDWGEQRSHP